MGISNLAQEPVLILYMCCFVGISVHTCNSHLCCHLSKTGLSAVMCDTCVNSCGNRIYTISGCGFHRLRSQNRNFQEATNATLLSLASCVLHGAGRVWCCVGCTDTQQNSSLLLLTMRVLGTTCEGLCQADSVLVFLL